MIHDSPSLSVVIPVRAQSAAFYVERLRLRDSCDLTGTETILTDDGSPEAEADNLRAFSDERGWRYQRLETGHLPFSLARARNAGAAFASSPWVFFDDADMVYETAFFSRLHKELGLLDGTPFTFLSLPAVYLSQESSKKVLARGSIDELVPDFLTRLALEDPRGGNDNIAIQNYAPASAILVMKKETALANGGYDEGFEGWGGEDREFIFRLLAANDKLPKPNDFTATRVWNLNDTYEFAGWRSLFRLHGDYMARKGFYAYHLFHEPNAWRTSGDRGNIEEAARRALSHSADSWGPAEEDASHRNIRNSLLFSVYKDVASAKDRHSSPQRRSKGAVIAARIRKLAHDPHAFFRDSKLPLSNRISRLFRERTNEVGKANFTRMDE